MPYKLYTAVKQLIIMLIAILLIASVVMVTLNLHQATAPAQKASASADSFMHGVKAKSFNQLGNIEDTVTSDYVTRDLKTGTTILQHPYIVAAADDAPAWHIHALYGKLTGPQQKIVYLWGNVKISQPVGPNSQNLTLLTPSLRYDSNSEFASTNAPVTIIQPDSIIHGVGMTANIKQGDIKILHNTDAQYVVAKQPKGAPK
ncbi:MAG: LPS export ABC transporter periplasmic protein LptC [Gammaproteobacteria bacterium]|nr:LPS export ABC transporter periplasmic protein LptC [Gammaproteobacteria bacterium]